MCTIGLTCLQMRMRQLWPCQCFTDRVSVCTSAAEPTAPHLNKTRQIAPIPVTLKAAAGANWGPEISANHGALIKSNRTKDGGKKENKELTVGVTCGSHRFSSEMSCDEPLALITAYATQWKGSVTHTHTHTHAVTPQPSSWSCTAKR